MFCYIVNYLLTWILKPDKICWFTSQTDPKFCLDGLNLIYYHTVSCHRNCAVIRESVVEKLKIPAFSSNVWIPMFSTKLPLQFIMYQHQFSIHRCVANEEHLDTLQIHDEQQQDRSLWCLSHRSVKPKFKEWSRMAAINFENLKVSGIANILVRWLSVEALRPVTRPNAQWHHLFRRPYLGKVEVRKCGTTLKRPTWFDGCIPKFVLSETNWSCDVLFLFTRTSMFNNLNNRHRRK